MQTRDRKRDRDFIKRRRQHNARVSIRDKLKTSIRAYLRELQENNRKGSGFLTSNVFITDRSPCDVLQQFSDQIEHIGSGTYGHVFKLCLDPNYLGVQDDAARVCPYVLKLTPFEKEVDPINYIDIAAFEAAHAAAEAAVDPLAYVDQAALEEAVNNEIHDPRRPENVEVLQAIHLQQLLDQNPAALMHLSLPFAAFPCDTSHLPPGLLESEEEKLPEPQKFNAYISEYATHGDLRSFIQGEDFDMETLEVLVFQLVYLIATIQEKDPSFRHNDLSLSNVLVTEAGPDDTPHYRFGDHHFRVPCRFKIRLWDLDFSNSDAWPNNKVRDEDGVQIFEEKYGIVTDPCLQYDLSFFFTDLANTLDLRKYPDDALTQYVMSWIEPTLSIGALLETRTLQVFENDRLTADAQRNIQDLVTTCTAREAPVPYSEFTAAYSLAHCRFFDRFRRQRYKRYKEYEQSVAPSEEKESKLETLEPVESFHPMARSSKRARNTCTIS